MTRSVPMLWDGARDEPLAMLDITKWSLPGSNARIVTGSSNLAI
jgi:hypothetical protein